MWSVCCVITALAWTLWMYTRGRGPLHAACEGGHLGVAQLLLSAGASPNGVDTCGQSSLMPACDQGHAALVDLLVAHGADLDAQDGSGRCPLLSASVGGHTAIVKLLAARGASTNLADASGQTPLLAACEAGHVAVVMALLQRGADADHRDRHGRTALHLAAEDGHRELVQLLVDRESPVTATDAAGNTPRALALERGHLAVAAMLQRARAPLCGPCPCPSPAPTTDTPYTRVALDVAFSLADHSPALFHERVGAVLRSFGVCVVTDVLTPRECDAHCDALCWSLEQLSDGFTRRDLSTYEASVLPPMAAVGMFQSRLGAVRAAWEVRADPRVATLFEAAYSSLRESPVTQFVTSIDGVNLRPPVPPYHDPQAQDWAHFDVGRFGATLECVQGQVVLSDTSGCLRVSPKSHLLFEAIMGCMGFQDPGSVYDFVPLRPSLYDRVATMVRGVGGQFQVPLFVPRGSVILWLSSTLHSAQTQSPPGTVQLEGSPWADWRCVVYVCYRPKEEVDDDHLDRLQAAFRRNLCTNHSGKATFPSDPGPSSDVRHTAKIRTLVSQEGDGPGLHPALAATMTPDVHRLLARYHA